MIDLISILKSHEQVNIEVKSAAAGVPNSIWETYSAFANTFGGTIILGVEEDRTTGALTLVGVSDPQKMQSDLWNTLNNRQKINTNILLEHHIYQMELDEKTVVVIEVPRADRRDKPVYVGQDMFKGTYRRNYEGDYHCSSEEIKAMLRDQAETSQDALMLENLMIGDLNQESIRDYRMIFRNLKPDHIWTKLADDEFLLKIGAAKKSQIDHKIHPTLAGLIFFGDFITITDELPHYFLDYRERLPGDTRWMDRVSSGDGNWSGNVFDFYYKIIDRMTSDVKKPFRLDSNLARIDDTPVHKALREMLANALIHADYYGRRGIVIEKEFRTISISNPGVFRIGIDEAIAGGISDARNGRIFNMFSLINVGERSGTGLCNVYHVWKENGFISPVIEETIEPERITVTLQMTEDAGQSSAGKSSKEGISYVRDGNFGENESNSDGNEGNMDANEGNHDGNEGNLNVNEGNHDGNEGNPSNGKSIYEKNIDDFALTKNESLILKAIMKNPEISAVKIADQCGISKSTAERGLRSLKKKGIIRRQGSTRGKWIVV